jgi:hypothetical protein
VDSLDQLDGRRNEKGRIAPAQINSSIDHPINRFHGQVAETIFTALSFM